MRKKPFYKDYYLSARAIVTSMKGTPIHYPGLLQIAIDLLQKGLKLEAAYTDANQLSMKRTGEIIGKIDRYKDRLVTYGTLKSVHEGIGSNEYTLCDIIDAFNTPIGKEL